jgi:hypothetical protein
MMRRNNWISLTSEDTGSGNDTLTFEVRENFTSSARLGSINLSGIDHIVVQDGGLGEALRLFDRASI